MSMKTGNLKIEEIVFYPHGWTNCRHKASSAAGSLGDGLKVPCKQDDDTRFPGLPTHPRCTIAPVRTPEPALGLASGWNLPSHFLLCKSDHSF